ncbi:hypothetical protein [Hymenobacter psychrotolerans]|uniref:Uncharacterized protein n=1 Tax=Hymenobacter psychrotolerans DSM 18569 TaxID=1121959 RepID=A0A1M7AH44_9BACT|nr:hypothetical protein [Hymenobacter psychrotolerans]SHL41935.1 hypothetical protein SAMN02746009_02720 [Hymenobacter psychrotolerans DSM 18569]
MKQKPLEPSFNMPQAELLLMASTKLGYMRRDAADFAGRGVKPARLDGFDTLIQQFADMPTEEEMVQSAAVLTQAKDALRVQLLSAMQALMGKVGLKHNDRTPAYKAFGTSGLNSAREAELYTGIRQAVRVGRRTLSDYKEQGVTEAELAALADLNEQFLDALHEQQDAENESYSTTQTRLRAANALYEELSYLSEVGKALYVQTDVTKHEQYVIYDKVPAPKQ